MIRRSLRRGALLATALTVLLILPASAHPYVQGGEVPVDSLATLTLAMAHGCDTETAGEGEPTIEVALDVPDWLRIVEVPEPDGWDVELETADDGVTVEVVAWTTDDPQEPAPTFDLDVVAAGEPGEELFLGVFQACETGSYRWVGTPDDPADDPAVRLRLVDADPDSPAPPEPEPEAEPEPEPEPDPEPEADGAAEDDVTDADTTDDGEATDADDRPGDGDPAEDEQATDGELDGDPAADATDDGGIAWPLILVPVVIAIVAVLLVGRRRGSLDPPGDEG